MFFFLLFVRLLTRKFSKIYTRVIIVNNVSVANNVFLKIRSSNKTMKRIPSFESFKTMYSWLTNIQMFGWSKQNAKLYPSSNPQKGIFFIYTLYCAAKHCLWLFRGNIVDSKYVNNENIFEDCLYNRRLVRCMCFCIHIEKNLNSPFFYKISILFFLILKMI